MTANLEDLYRRVTEATEPSRELDLAIATEVDGWVLEKRKNDRKKWLYRPGGADHERLDPSPYFLGYRSLPAFTASVDAALTLAERLLPSCEWAVSRTDCTCLGMAQPIWFTASLHGGSNPQRAVTPALAIIAAVLKAKIEND